MTRDYILRIIEQFTQALLEIVRARKAKNYEQAFQLIQTSSQRYLFTDIDKFLTMTPDQLLKHFKQDKKNLDAEKCMMCAELLYETGLVCESNQRLDLSLLAKILSFHLYLNAIPHEKEFQTQAYFDRVNELSIYLQHERIPEAVTTSLLAYRKFFQE